MNKVKLSDRELAYIVALIGRDTVRKDSLELYERLLDSMNGRAVISLHDFQDQFKEEYYASRNR